MVAAMMTAANLGARHGLRLRGIYGWVFVLEPRRPEFRADQSTIEQWLPDPRQWCGHMAMARPPERL